VPIVALIAVATAVAVRIAGERDLGASALASRDAPPARTFLLGGQGGLSLRLARPAVIGWTVALVATGLVFGLVAQAAGSALKGSQSLQHIIERLGGTSAGAASYLGFVFVSAAGLVAIAVAGQISATRNEEASGHLDNLLVRSVPRWRWLAVRVAVAAGLVVVASVLAGVAAWIGAASQHTGIAFGDMVKAGLNVTPPALFVLGIGVLAFGLWPRAAIGVTYGLVVWSFLAEIVAGTSSSFAWLKNTSPLLHITPVPAAAPDWTAAAWMIGLGLLAALLGLATFQRRDLVTA
jgi:ABC-2 type transport system permease protein